MVQASRVLRPMFRRFIPGFKTLRRFLPAIPGSAWGRAPQIVCALSLLGISAPANAQDAPRLLLVQFPSDTHLVLGPSVAAVHRDQAWDSEVGAQLQLHRRRQSPTLSAFGLSLSAATFAKYEGIRLALDGYAGTRLLGGIPIGLGLGPVADVFLSHRPRGGARASIWFYAGVVPYVSFATMHGLGAPDEIEVQAGLKIPFSLVHW